MANRECHGDFFTAEGERFYRCIWDGSLIGLVPGRPFLTCTNCQREIEGQDHGEVAVETVRTVVLPDVHGAVRLPLKRGN